MTAVIGLYLLSASRLPKGAGVLAASAFLPVVANGYYWFHDVRMLFEARPAWIVLGVIAALGLAGGLSDTDQEHAGDWRGWVADMVTWTILVGVVGAAVWGAPTAVGQLSMERRDSTAYYGTGSPHRRTRDRLRSLVLE